jgi:putative membrane-bound dehydrogenase-like protein
MLHALLLANALLAAPVDMPRVVDDRLQLELILQEPDIVTPVGLTLDARGRILVIESHTHFRPEGYVGPENDRILLVDPNEKPAKPRVWYEGSKQTMGIGRAPDDSIYVATRSQIFRLRDTDGDDRADERKEIAHLETAGNYPHNGLSGFAFLQHHGVGADEVYFGFGENLGADYELIGSDGTTLPGGGEGGNIYSCTLDGKSLRRVATGFWNPFHLAFSSERRLFTVDNDPDSRPPCRLLHVVEGGDYGFKFRHGRKGTHPFTAWNGELPGTLPMVCGTGEAPSGMALETSRITNSKGKSFPLYEIPGSFLVTSWGDHRIERYRLQPRGESYTATMEPVVVGGENFRPVGIAYHFENGVYFSDWVDKSYPLHRKGRLWRLSEKPKPPRSVGVASSPDLVRSSGGSEPGDRPRTLQAEWSALAEARPNDSFRWQTLSLKLTHLQQVQPPLDEATARALLQEYSRPTNPEATIWAAVAAKNANASNAKALVPHLLAHDEPRVRTLGVIWIGDEGMTEFRGDVEKTLSQPGLTRELFECSLAALEMLDRAADPNPPKQDNKRATSGDFFVLKALRNAQASPALRRFALKTLPPDHPELKFELLKQLADDADPTMRIEAIRTLRDRPVAERAELLRTIAIDTKRSDAERAEAVMGLNRAESGDLAVLEGLQSAAGRETASEVRRLLQQRDENTTPVAARITSLLDGGDATAGERLFFHSRIGACYRCHEYAGRGAAIGPELTTIGRSNSRERLLRSILEPSREIGPSYVPWIIETTDGRTLTGLYVGEEIKGEHRYADAQGKIFRVHPNEFAHREAAKQSIMPADFGKILTDEELRDLAAFLLQR